MVYKKAYRIKGDKMKKLLIACLIAFLLISPVAAETHKIHVDEKVIRGNGLGSMYIVGDNHGSTWDSLCWEEYMVTEETYNKIQYGTDIELELAESGYYRLIGENMNDIWGG